MGKRLHKRPNGYKTERERGKERERLWVRVSERERERQGDRRRRHLPTLLLPKAINFLFTESQATISPSRIHRCALTCRLPAPIPPTKASISPSSRRINKPPWEICRWHSLPSNHFGIKGGGGSSADLLADDRSHTRTVELRVVIGSARIELDLKTIDCREIRTESAADAETQAQAQAHARPIMCSYVHCSEGLGEGGRKGKQSGGKYRVLTSSPFLWHKMRSPSNFGSMRKEKLSEVGSTLVSMFFASIGWKGVPTWR